MPNRGSGTAPADAVVDVAIIGCGPVGATAALLASAAGLRVVVFERSEAIYTLPRAIHIDAQIMRMLAAVGLRDELLAVTTPSDGVKYINRRGRLIAEVKPKWLPDPLRNGGRERDSGHAFADSYFMYQPNVERVLRRAMEGHQSVELRLNSEVEAVQISHDRVDIISSDVVSGEHRETTARYAIACDGARSTIRGQFGITLEDLHFDQPWLVVDAFERGTAGVPPYSMQLCDPARPTTFLRSVDTHLRWEFMVLPGEDATHLEHPETIRALLARWGDPNAIEITRAAVYSFHALTATRWRVGPVFLAGDAAHQMPVFQGQGLCSGLRDVENLIWKLRLMRSGQASEALLDTYEQERRPHVLAITRQAMINGRVIQTRSRLRALIRDLVLTRRYLPRPPRYRVRRVMPPIAAGLIDDSPNRKAIRQRGKSRADAWGIGTVFPQARVTITPESAAHWLDDLTSRRFSLLVKDANPSDLLSDAASRFWRTLPAAVFRVCAVGATPPPSDTTTLEDSDGVILHLMDTWHADVIVLRPDRYVFTSTTLSDLDAVTLRLSASLGASDRSLPGNDPSGSEPDATPVTTAPSATHRGT